MPITKLTHINSHENQLPGDWPQWYLLQEYYKQQRAAADSRNRHTMFVINIGVLVIALVVALFASLVHLYTGVCR